MGDAAKSDQARAVLIISHEFDPHVDQVVTLFDQLGVPCFRWPTSNFPTRSSVSLHFDDAVQEGEIRAPGWRVSLGDIRSVWYRHPAAHAYPPELSADERRFAEGETRATLAGLFQVTDWFWVNHPDRVRIAGSKTLQLRRAAELGFRTPRTLITNNPDEVRAFFRQSPSGIVYKSFYPGFFDAGEKVCFTTPLFEPDLDSLDLLKHSPGIFQERLDKQFELRITIIGARVFATAIHSQHVERARDDWREADAEELPHEPFPLPPDIERRCLELLRGFGLAYGAIDMIVTPDGEYIFLENNPSGQFGWIEGRTGEPMTATLAQMLVAGRIVDRA